MNCWTISSSFTDAFNWDSIHEESLKCFHSISLSCRSTNQLSQVNHSISYESIKCSAAVNDARIQSSWNSLSSFKYEPSDLKLKISQLFHFICSVFDDGMLWKQIKWTWKSCTDHVFVSTCCHATNAVLLMDGKYARIIKISTPQANQLTIEWVSQRKDGKDQKEILTLHLVSLFTSFECCFRSFLVVCQRIDISKRK